MPGWHYRNMNFEINDLSISDDKTLLDIDFIHKFLSQESYWAKGRPKEIVKKSIENSFCLGLFKANKQIGFLRVVTDYATYGYLCDVFIEEKYRNAGYGQIFLKALFNDSRLQTISWYLRTTYSQSLYGKFDFNGFESAAGWMRKKPITL